MIWNLLLKGVIIAIHNEQVAEHGGICGIRDDGLLDSALARPQHQSCYCSASVFDLVAAYASGIIRDHPFTDGNKRTAFLASYVFLVINGWQLQASEIDALNVVLALATGEIDEAAFSNWLQNNSVEMESNDPHH